MLFGSGHTLVVFVLFITDYILTYKGIQLNIITEANPIMKWLFDLSFLKGLFVRVFLGGVLLIPLYLCKKRNYVMYKGAIMTLILAYILVMILHIRWMFYYMNQ